MRSSSARVFLGVIVVLGLSIGPSSPRAFADASEQCVAQHQMAQQERRDGKLRATRRALEHCAAANCPTMIVSDCVQWMSEVDALLPSIIVVATSVGGNDLSRVRVTMDGELLADHLSGDAIPVDKGEHRFRFEAEGFPPVERSLLVREGEQLRRIEVRFEASPKAAPRAAAPTTAPPVRDESTSVLPWVFGGVGIAALVGAGAFGVRALTVKSDLDDSGCKPTCSSDDVDAGRQSALVADVLGAVGIASLGAAVVLLIVQGRRDGQAAKAALPGLAF